MGKALRLFSDIFALPLFILLYWTVKLPHPLIFTAYILCALIFQEFGLKRIFKRHRPAWSTKSGYAFPSSHSFVSMLAFVVTLYLPVPLKPYILLFCTIIPFSRIATGAHYFVDVIAGMLIGSIFGAMWIHLLGQHLTPWF